MEQFFADLVARGLAGIGLVISDARRSGRGHRGEPARSDPAPVPHPLRREPNECHTEVDVAGGQAMLHSVYDQPDAAAVSAHFDAARLRRRQAAPVGRAPRRCPRRHPGLDRLPKNVWTQIRSNNPSERLNIEIRRRTDAVGTFANRDAIVRLVGVALAEQTDESTEGRRYLGLEPLARCRPTSSPTPQRR